MIRLGLTGYPLGHSFSPLLHAAALRACDLDGEYSLYSVPPEGTSALAELLGRVRTGELTGLNVTVPHKQSVIPLLDELTPAARAIGAVNTIFLKDEKLIGDNTDAPGFLADLKKLIDDPRSALVLGAGGAARAVVYALHKSGCEVVIAARRVEQAAELAARFPNVRAIPLSIETLDGLHAQLIVNTTSVGMFHDTDKSPWPSGAAFPDNAAVYDLVYNPRETLLVRQARAAGLRAVSGLGMLVEQAALAFEIWTGRKIERAVMHEALKQTAP